MFCQLFIALPYPLGCSLTELRTTVMSSPRWRGVYPTVGSPSFRISASKFRRQAVAGATTSGGTREIGERSQWRGPGVPPCSDCPRADQSCNGGWRAAVTAAAAAASRRPRIASVACRCPIAVRLRGGCSCDVRAMHPAEFCRTRVFNGRHVLFTSEYELMMMTQTTTTTTCSFERGSLACDAARRLLRMRDLTDDDEEPLVT